MYNDSIYNLLKQMKDSKIDSGFFFNCIRDTLKQFGTSQPYGTNDYSIFITDLLGCLINDKNMINYIFNYILPIIRNELQYLLNDSTICIKLCKILYEHNILLKQTDFMVFDETASFNCNTGYEKNVFIIIMYKYQLGFSPINKHLEISKINSFNNRLLL